MAFYLSKWLFAAANRKENAMQTVSRFLQKFASLIVYVLSCYDRVIFQGRLSLCRAAEVEKLIDYVLEIRRVDFFKKRAPQWAERLVNHAKRMAAAAGRPYVYRTGKFEKDRWAEKIFREQPVVSGVIAVLCTRRPRV